MIFGSFVMATPVVFASVGSTLYALVLLCLALFLILLVLVQRGRGGGLSGAFGGMGGQSAFGTKAGDTFTRITVVAATIWIVLCIIAAKYLGGTAESRFAAAAGDAATQTRAINLDDANLEGALDATLGTAGADTEGTDESPAAGPSDESIPADGGDTSTGSTATPAEGDEN
jgi:preprotein translocase subunit SecG